MHLNSLHTALESYSSHSHLLCTFQSNQKRKRSKFKFKTHNGIGDISTNNSILFKLTKENDDPITKSISFYRDLLQRGISPNTFTFPCLLKLLANSRALNAGKMIHAQIIKFGFELDPYIRNNLIRFYSLCGQIDSKTLVSVLNACTNLGALDLGRWVHVYMIRLGFKPDGFLGNALVDLYSKCGIINHAQQVFDEMIHRDVFTYTSLILGLAMHGKGNKALNLFNEMLSVGIKPSEVTFIGVLNACSHAGLVKEGLSYFDNMLSKYGVKPKLEHYGCVVDMLGRAGYLNEAEKFINEMPIEPDLFIWGSLLAACKTHRNVEMGERVMRVYLGVRNKDGDYVLMSNLYASFNRYYDSIQVRKEMRRNKVKKVPGRSWIEIDGVIHEFGAINKPEF
ncbi:hypothetical protein LUZ60_007309 [Juncus effusus]|nr:hypothetical protein LUZ60_007309 [Juncus effusus]